MEQQMFHSFLFLNSFSQQNCCIIKQLIQQLVIHFFIQTKWLKA
jgi:hypothetical protein